VGDFALASLPMYPLVPEPMLETCVEFACYCITVVAAVASFMLTGRT
jgi:hypothetical protein